MGDFREFIEDAILMGKRNLRRRHTGLIPLFIPDGPSQVQLYEDAIQALVDLGFKVLDVRGGIQNKYVFPYNWPEIAGLERKMEEQYNTRLVPAESLLLVAAGREYLNDFWRCLADERKIIAGRKGIVVPDVASVAAIVSAENFLEYSDKYFGPFCRFRNI